jgi:hypothetical protein
MISVDILNKQPRSRIADKGWYSSFEVDLGDDCSSSKESCYEMLFKTAGHCENDNYDLGPLKGEGFLDYERS